MVRVCLTGSFVTFVVPESLHGASSMMNWPDGLLLTTELHGRSVLIAVNDGSSSTTGSGAVSSSTGADARSPHRSGSCHHAVSSSGMDAHGTTVIAATRFCLLGIGIGCGSSAAKGKI